MFKRGDKVMQKNGRLFSNDRRIATVEVQENMKVWLQETKTYIHQDSIELAEVMEINVSEAKNVVMDQLSLKLQEVEKEANNIKNVMEVLGKL